MEDNYKPRPVATKKRIEAFRTTAPELTDEVLNKIIEDRYPNKFIPENEVALEVIKETYREELSLSQENFVAQLTKLTEGRRLLKWQVDVHEAEVLRKAAEALVEKIYDAASNGSCKLSDFPDATKDVLDFLNKDDTDSKSIEHGWNNLFCNYYCRKNGYVSCGFAGAGWPPFRPLVRDGEIYFVHHLEDARTAINRLKGSEVQSQEVKPAKGGCAIWLFVLPLSSLFAYLIF